ncbi:MAG: SPFH domain-containing protein [Xanthomonadales bacterium]|nr:SPFH domain-containing protein [Xanthomonadales bacterium]
MSTWAIGLLIAIPVILLVMAVHRVPAAESHIVRRLGHAHRTLSPGWHVIVPVLERVAHRVSMSGRVLEVRVDGLETSDQHPMQAQGVLYFQVLDVNKAVDQLGQLDTAARNLTESVVRDFVADISRASLELRSSDEISNWLLGLLNETSTGWGVRITRVELELTRSANEDGAASG